MNGDMIVVTHIPSGITASCLLNLHRCQYETKDRALSLLKSRLWASQHIEVSLDDIHWKYDSCSKETSQTQS